MTERLGDGPIEPKFKENMNAVAAALDQTFNGKAKGAERSVGFVLMVFPFGEIATGRCNYISNGANRKDVVTLM
jgi:hypothetical protein